MCQGLPEQGYSIRGEGRAVMKYVIIGNSAAGIGAVQGIRELDKDGDITMISDENYHTYSRPLISYWLKGDVTEEGMKYRPNEFYTENKANALLGKKVVSIDKKNKTVLMDDASVTEYDKLLVATGSNPFVPQLEGLDKVKNKFTFMKMDDVRAVRERLSKNSKVLIIGAGLIGLKAAEAMVRFTNNITVIDLSERILPAVLNEEASHIMKHHIETTGVRFVLGTTVKEFSENTATLTNGDSIDFDILILAVGVRPNTELIDAIGGKVDRGIVTDDTQAVKGLSDIYAAGDCTKSHDITSNTDKMIAILPNAFMQGNVAGKNMAGGVAHYTNAFPMNAAGFFGLHIITAGSYSGEEHTTISESGYKNLFIADNKLKGFILMGDMINNAGIYTSLVREQTPLNEVDLALLLEKPALMAFPAEYRKEKLGGQR